MNSKLRYPLKGILYINRLGNDNPVAEYPLAGHGHRLTLKAFPNETTIRKLTLRAVKDKKGGITVNRVIGNKNKILLEDRVLSDKGTASLKEVPYVLRYRLK